MIGIYLDFNPQCAVEVIKKEHHELSFTIPSYGKGYLFLEGAAKRLITWSTLNGDNTLACDQVNH